MKFVEWNNNLPTKFVNWKGLTTKIWIAECRQEDNDRFEIHAHNYDCGYFVIASFKTRQQAEHYFAELLKGDN